MSDAEGEAAETQTWIQFAVECEYIDRDEAAELFEDYEHILKKLVTIINDPDPWLLNDDGGAEE